LGKEERKSSGLGAHQNQALLPRLVVRKGKKKSRINSQNSSRKALFHDEKEKSSSPSTASDKIGPVNKEANCDFALIRVI